MTVDKRRVAEVRRQVEMIPDDATGDLRRVDSVPELIAVLVAQSRAAGDDEVADVELFCEAAELTRPEAIEASRVLRKLGFVAVADVLKRYSQHKRPRRRNTSP